MQTLLEIPDAEALLTALRAKGESGLIQVRALQPPPLSSTHLQMLRKSLQQGRGPGEEGSLGQILLTLPRRATQIPTL